MLPRALTQETSGTAYRGPLCLHISMFFLSLAASLVFCHSPLLCPLSLTYQATYPIVIHSKSPSCPFLGLLAVEGKLALVGVPALPLTSCVALGKTLTFSEPQFPHM